MDNGALLIIGAVAVAIFVALMWLISRSGR
jgi:hypothetical protein